MSGGSPYAVSAIVLITLLTLAIGAFGYRFSRNTSDFLVASRAVSPRWNASAISGEYLSAASFLGVAGLIMKYGANVLWYPVGFTTGYLAMLLFVAAPLRRSGAYTLPDFAELRLSSRPLRRLSTAFVVLIGWLYLVPQLRGAGLTLSTVAGVPAWVGAVSVGAVVIANVAAGGMRSITFVQAFQYWVKLTAIALPVMFLLVVWQWRDARPGGLSGASEPTFPDRTTVQVRDAVVLEVADPVGLWAHGRVDGRAVGAATAGRVDGRAAGSAAGVGPLAWQPGRHVVAAGTELVFPAGTAVPTVAGGSQVANAQWVAPLSGLPSHDHPLFGTYSLILATFLGTMGLPHVLVRFYTNPDGRAARTTTVLVLGLLGLFYLFPTVYGALGRVYTPELLLTGSTDAVVLVLPGAAVGGLVGRLLAGLVAAGAFAAFLSTSSGLVVSVAGVLATDVLGRAGVRRRRPRPGGGVHVVREVRDGRDGGAGGSRRESGSVRDFRRSALLAGVVPLGLALRTGGLDISQVVGLAFAVAASTFCPLLVLGVWWRGLTAVGAGAGLVVGGGLSGVAVVLTMLGAHRDGWLGALLAEPAAATVPLAFATMVLVSRLTRRRVPAGIGRIMLGLHAPESLRLRSAELIGDEDDRPAV